VSLSFQQRADISFVKDSKEDACACLVILEYPSLRVVYENCKMVKLTAPYPPPPPPLPFLQL
jgi:deoxyinosine 3'endonuclease (endonuclease V)